MTNDTPKALTGTVCAAIALLVPALLWALPTPAAPDAPSVWTQPDIPALPAAIAAPDTVPAGPQFTPHEEAPELRNRAEFIRALREAYPADLHEEGIGGRVLVWIYVDEEGLVRETRVAAGSSEERLDAAAVEVARQARFSPALNRGQPVAVWVQFPVIFQAR